MAMSSADEVTVLNTFSGYTVVSYKSCMLCCCNQPNCV